jgi:asparagine synthetase B (glutamine-hydrolysing)
MDSTDPDIFFNEKGECNHCLEFTDKREKHKYQGSSSDAQLDQLISEMKAKGQGKEYDCVVGLSGGIDSSYVAYIA